MSSSIAPYASNYYFFFLICIQLSSFGQGSFKAQSQGEVSKVVLNDTIEVVKTNLSKIETIYKNSHGRTLTIYEKDSLIAYYEIRNENVLFSIKRGKPTVVTLTFPNESDYNVQVNRLNQNVVTKKGETEKKLIGQQLPTGSMLTVDGEKLSFDNLRGKVVVINFWFAGCAPCIKELPELNRLVDYFKGEDIVFIALALDSADEVKSFLQKRKFNYKQIVSAQSLTLQFGVQVWPTHIIADKNGVIRFVQSGGEDIFNVLKQGIESTSN